MYAVATAEKSRWPIKCYTTSVISELAKIAHSLGHNRSGPEHDEESGHYRVSNQIIVKSCHERITARHF